MTRILTPLCPLCSEEPIMVFGGGTQAFCGNDECTLLTWNPALSLDANLLDAKGIDFPPMGDEKGKSDE